jgi:hypothetical protein
MGQYRAGQLDRADEVGVQRLGQFLVGEFFHRSEQPVAGVGEDHVDTAQLGEGALDHCVDLVGVGDVQPRQPDLLAEAVRKLGQGLWTARRGCHAVACGEQLLGDRASHARTGSRDEPCLRH